MIMKKSLLAALSLLILPLSAGADEQWQVTTSMESASMGMSMPAMTRKVCVPDGTYNKSSEKMVPAKDNCKVSNFKASGSTSSFHMECGAPHKMSGDGQFTRKGSDAYSGDIKMQGDFGQGGNGDMHMHFDGQKLGACTAEKPQDDAAGYTSRMNAQMSAACTQGLSQMQPGIFMIPACQSFKPQFCARVKSFLGNTTDPEQLRSVIEQREDWAQLADSCDMDSLSIQTAACSKAKDTHNWGAVAKVCNASEAKTLAREHCTGRSYSSVMTGEYGPLCQAFSDAVHVDGSAGSKTGSIMDAGSKAMDSIGKLKGLFSR